MQGHAPAVLRQLAEGRFVTAGWESEGASSMILCHPNLGKEQGDPLLVDTAALPELVVKLERWGEAPEVSRLLLRAFGSEAGTIEECAGARRALAAWLVDHGQPEGAAVTFRNGAAESFYTLRAPQGWRTNRGLEIGDPEATVTAIYGTLPRAECGTYSALVLRRGRTETQFYVYDGKVWGFGLSSAGAPRCH